MTALNNSYNIVYTDETKRGQARIFEMNTEKKSLSNAEKMKRCVPLRRNVAEKPRG